MGYVLDKNVDDDGKTRLDRGLEHFGLSKSNFDAQLRGNPDMLLTMINEMADEKRAYYLGRLNNVVSPSKFELQKYEDMYENSVDEMYDKWAIKFAAVRNLDAANMAPEVADLLPLEDEMYSKEGDLLGVGKNEGYRTFLSMAVLKNYLEQFVDTVNTYTADIQTKEARQKELDTTNAQKEITAKELDRQNEVKERRGRELDAYLEDQRKKIEVLNKEYEAARQRGQAELANMNKNI